MKKLTHEEIKALPKGTKVLVEFEIKKVDDSPLPYLVDKNGFGIWLYKDNPIYLPTPELQPLSEEMPKEFAVMVGGMGNAKYLWAYVRENYGTAPREWWMDLKPGDKFVHNGKVKTLRKVSSSVIFYSNEDCDVFFVANNCRPYIELTEEEKFIASLSPEQKEAYKKLKHG